MDTDYRDCGKHRDLSVLHPPLLALLDDHLRPKRDALLTAEEDMLDR